MDIEIRPLEEKDKKAFGSLYEESILTDFPEYSTKTRQHFASGKYKEDMWMLPVKLGAFADGLVVGYVLSEYPIGGVAFMHWLAVHKNFQRQGVGKRLVLAIEPILKAKGTHSIHLQSEMDDVPFYEKCGYEVYGKDDKGYFGAYDYLLRKILQEPNEETYF